MLASYSRQQALKLNILDDEFELKYAFPFFRVRFFGMVRIRISDPRLNATWCVKLNDKSILGEHSSVSLIHHDRSDFGSPILLRILPIDR